MLDDRAKERPAVGALQPAVVVRRPRPFVVDEDHPVADEDLVLDLDSLADERVALDLAARADYGSTLDLDEGADTRAVADRAAVEVRERVDHHALTEGDPVEQPELRVVGGLVSHRTMS